MPKLLYEGSKATFLEDADMLEVTRRASCRRRLIETESVEITKCFDLG
jgi:hypothetical protein